MHAETTVERLKPEPYLRTAEPRGEKDVKLPGLNDAYQAAGFPDNGELTRLVLVMGKDGFKPGGVAYYVLPYVHMGIAELGFTARGEQVFRVVFADLEPKRVTVTGRNLLRVLDYIGLHRMPWVRQADRDFGADDGAAGSEPIITRIEVEDWKPPGGGEDAA